jgi:hypothetical protein
MGQRLTITIDGWDGVRPDVVGDLLRAVFELVDSIDIKSWQVHAKRVQWRIADAKLVNPLTLTASGRESTYGAGSEDLAVRVLDGLDEVQRGRRPSLFSDSDLNLASIIGAKAKDARSIVIKGESEYEDKHLSREFHVTKTLNTQARNLLRRKSIVTNEYGSIEGTLINLANDPLKEGAAGRIRDRVDQYDVNYSADPATAAKLGQYLNRSTRVVLYGTVTYEDRVPKKIDVEAYTTIPDDDNLPTLEDIHAMRLHPPGGLDVEDYLDELRGDE